MAEKNNSKKVWNSLYHTVDLPEGVSAEYVNGYLKVKGPKGEVERKLKFPRIVVTVEGNTVKIGTDKLTKREKKIINTYIAHVKNLIKGVTEGFTYKLVVLFAKFPVTVEMKGDTFTVKNLLGEKVPRTVKVPSDVKVEVKGKDITVSGIDIEKTGQVAASLEQLTKVTNMDRRVVQDGIFIVEKPHRKIA
jgi:large subunit ribosomal protein L6